MNKLNEITYAINLPWHSILVTSDSKIARKKNTTNHETVKLNYFEWKINQNIKCREIAISFRISIKTTVARLSWEREKKRQSKVNTGHAWYASEKHWNEFLLEIIAFILKLNLHSIVIMIWFSVKPITFTLISYHTRFIVQQFYLHRISWILLVEHRQIFDSFFFYSPKGQTFARPQKF